MCRYVCDHRCFGASSSTRYLGEPWGTYVHQLSLPARCSCSQPVGLWSIEVSTREKWRKRQLCLHAIFSWPQVAGYRSYTVCCWCLYVGIVLDKILHWTRRELWLVEFWTSMLLTLSALLYVSPHTNRFALRLDDSHTVEMVPEVILRAKYGIKLYLDPLNKN